MKEITLKLTEDEIRELITLCSLRQEFYHTREEECRARGAHTLANLKHNLADKYGDLLIKLNANLTTDSL